MVQNTNYDLFVWFLPLKVYSPTISKESHDNNLKWILAKKISKIIANNNNKEVPVRREIPINLFTICAWLKFTLLAY